MKRKTCETCVNCRCPWMKDRGSCSFHDDGYDDRDRAKDNSAWLRDREKLQAQLKESNEYCSQAVEMVRNFVDGDPSDFADGMTISQLAECLDEFLGGVETYYKLREEKLKIELKELRRLRVNSIIKRNS